jgi:hypothetical protein
MPSHFAYEPVLSSRPASFLIGLSKAKQRRVIDLIFRLAENPTQLGDYATREKGGRDIQHLMVGDWHFSFWADHPVRELRITEIAEL